MQDAADVQILTDPVSRVACPKCSHKMDVQGLPAFASLVCSSCGYELTVPARLGLFLLLKIIGMGGMGAVYFAHDEVLNRQVAIKVMRKSLGDNPAFSETFLREAQTAAKINHPNIVHIYAFGKEKGQPYIVMELVQGGGLEKLMASGEPLDQVLVMRIGKQVADGLRHASDEGMVHGDVKPENILLGEGQVAKLVDFGLASVSGTASAEIWGTPYYIAPEKVKRQKADHRADIYSLGGTLYHALAGRPPFDGVDANAVVRARFSETLKPLTELRRDIDPDVAAIITRMLQNEPSLRYPTYGSLLSDIRRVLERLGPSVAAAPGGRKIVLRRKGGAVQTDSADIDSAGPAASGVPLSGSQTSSEKKIVVGRGVMTSDTVRSGREETDATSSAKPRRVLRVIMVIVVLVVIGILGVVGGLYGLMMWGKKQAAKLETEMMQQVRVRDDAVTRLQSIADRAKGLADQCAADAAKALALATNVAAQATPFVSEVVRPYVTPPRPESAPQEADADAVPPETEPEPEVTRRPSGESDANRLAEAAAAVAAAGLPVTAENIALFAKKLRKKSAPGASADKPNAAEKPAADGGADAEPVAAPIEELDLPVVVQRIRAIFQGVYELENAAEMTAKLFAEVSQAIQEPDVPSRSLEALQSLQADLTRRCDAVAAQRTVAEGKSILEGIEADHATALRLLDEVRADRTRQARDAQARDAAEQAAREKQRLEEEHKARVQTEAASVTATEGVNIELMHNLDFRKAARALRNLEEGIETPEGKAALALAQERLSRIEAFYEFLGGATAGVPVPGAGVVDAERPIAPFRHPHQGWIVQKSDARGITINAKTKQWQDVEDVLIVMIIRYLLKEERQATSLRFRYRIQQYINASLFLETFIVNSPAVKEMAVSFANEAVDLFPRSREEIDRLMPGLLKRED